MAKEKAEKAEKAKKPEKDEFDAVIGGLQKDWGEGNLFNGEEAALKDKRVLLSAPRLSWVYGGTFKVNGIHRFNGIESSGKTTVATILSGEMQRIVHEETGDWNNCHVVVLDNERTFDVKHAETLGLRLTNPDNGKPLVHVFRNLYVDDQEVGYERTVVTGKVCACIYDSDAAGIDKVSFGDVGYEDMSKATFGSGAAASGRVIKRMNYFVDRYTTPVFWISQERANQNPQAHLNQITGGFAVNFYPSTRFRVTAKEPLMEDGQEVGVKLKLKNYKNKTGVPHRECTIDVYFFDTATHKAGLDADGQYLDMLLELGYITQHGAWYYYREDDPDESKRVSTQGWIRMRQWFDEHPDEFEAAKVLVNNRMSGFDAVLDKNTKETSELEDIKLELQAEEERKKAASQEVVANLAEQALAASSEVPTEASTEA